MWPETSFHSNLLIISDYSQTPMCFKGMSHKVNLKDSLNKNFADF